MSQITLGSLFDGSGGFPLAGALCGVEPLWASEIEPYPITVTRNRFPNMKHLGNVSDIRGGEIEPVDIITFGSPCQDLSVAGKRAGLKHEVNGDDETTRSGLFMEAVRIIKEMRKATNGEYPRFVLWENVPGAFSSNQGEDFRTVLGELVKIVEPNAVMPAVPKAGWPYADSYRGDGWSLAYRVFDAQYWGVPQRRRRIHLVLDLRGERAREVLFEREGVRGYFAQGKEAREGASDDAAGSAGRSDRVKCLNPWDCQSKRIYLQDGVCPTLPTMDCGGANNQAVIYEPRSALEENWSETNVKNSLRANASRSGHAVVEHFQQNDVSGKTSPCVSERTQAPLCAAFMGGQGANAGGIGYSEEVSPTLKSVLSGGNTVPDVVYPEKARILSARHDSSPCSDRGQNVVALDCRNLIGNDGISGTLQAKNEGGFSLNFVNPVVYDCRGNGSGNIAPNLTGDHQNRVTDYTAICLQGNGIDRADTAGCNGCGWRLGKVYTLNTIDRHAVCVGNGQMHRADVYPDVTGVLCANSHPGSYTGQDAFNDMLPVYRQDRRYIVRRLTPLECCRLQGFPDGWGDTPCKDHFSDDEYEFWLAVRNTHASVNGKVVKNYTKDQMLKWYNGLHTDSSEYKMWGNGIALPTALYCMQGIVDAIIATNM